MRGTYFLEIQYCKEFWDPLSNICLDNFLRQALILLMRIKKYKPCIECRQGFRHLKTSQGRHVDIVNEMIPPSQ
jgi:hypothetical protein